VAEPIKIGASGRFTGGSSPMGVKMSNGVKLATAEINAAGALRGGQTLRVAVICQAGTADGVTLREVLGNHKEKVDCVVRVYYLPCTHEDHDALRRGDAVWDELENGHVIRAR